MIDSELLIFWSNPLLWSCQITCFYSNGSCDYMISWMLPFVHLPLQKRHNHTESYLTTVSNMNSTFVCWVQTYPPLEVNQPLPPFPSSQTRCSLEPRSLYLSNSGIMWPETSGLQPAEIPYRNGEASPAAEITPLIKERVQWGLKTKLPREFMVIYVPAGKNLQGFFCLPVIFVEVKGFLGKILGFKYLQTDPRCFGSLGFMLSKQRSWLGGCFHFSSLPPSLREMVKFYEHFYQVELKPPTSWGLKVFGVEINLWKGWTSWKYKRPYIQVERKELYLY